MRGRYHTRLSSNVAQAIRPGTPKLASEFGKLQGNRAEAGSRGSWAAGSTARSRRLALDELEEPAGVVAAHLLLIEERELVLLELGEQLVPRDVVEAVGVAGGSCRCCSPGSTAWPRKASNCYALAVLNINRDSMARFGFSPPTRVFEAAGAGACLITDAWEGIDAFLAPGEEVLVAADGGDVARLVSGLSAKRARCIGEKARARVLAHHTYARRARLVESALSGAALAPSELAR